LVAYLSSSMLVTFLVTFTGTSSSLSTILQVADPPSRLSMQKLRNKQGAVFANPVRAADTRIKKNTPRSVKCSPGCINFT
jgi:hypothetical protein